MYLKKSISLMLFETYHIYFYWDASAPATIFHYSISIHAILFQTLQRAPLVWLGYHSIIVSYG